MTKDRIHAGAADELEQAVLWYEKASPNLGLKFAGAFENQLQRLPSLLTACDAILIFSRDFWARYLFRS